jgi:hypothetical protein
VGRACRLYPKSQEKGGPFVSEGGNSMLREQQIETDSAEPPSLMGRCL